MIERMLKWLIRLGRVKQVRQEELAQYNLYDARRYLSRLVDRVIEGEQIVIARAGRPVVKLVAFDQVELTRPGLIRAEILIGDDQEAPGRRATPTRSSTGASS